MSEEFSPTSVPQSESEVDALLSAIESPEGMQPPPEVQPEQPGPETEAPPQEEPKTQAEMEFELSRKGAKEKFPLSKVLNLAQQGWDYNEKMREYRVNRELFEKERSQYQTQLEKAKELEQRLSQYREVEEYLKTDPEWWNHVQSSYQQRRQEQGHQASPYVEKIQTLESQLQELSQFVTSIKDRENATKKAQEDEALESQISEYKNQYSTFDWNTLDNQGLDLEKRILKHAMDNQIGSFRAAANDYLHEELMKRAEIKAKEETGKELKKATKLGLGPVTDKPTKKVDRVQNVRSKSWDDIEAEALSELGYA